MVDGIIRKHSIAMPLLLLVIFAAVCGPGIAQAQGFAISGTFYRQEFRIVPGETISSPDIYIVVFNQSDDAIRVKLTPIAPTGTELLLTQTQFDISARDNRKVEVGVRVSPDAVPGEYTVAITADVVAQTTGIVITSGAQQQASLRIFGEAGRARINVTTYDGQDFPSEIHLFHKEGIKLTPTGYSPTGTLDLRMVPGEYRVQVLYQGNEVATKDFFLQADTTEEFTMIARTVTVLGFSAVPNFRTNTGEMAFAKIVYTIRNLYRPEKSPQAVLNVFLNNGLLEQNEIFSLPTLDVGNTSASYNYVPSQGWDEGDYAFQMQVLSQENGLLIAESRKVGLRLIRVKEGLRVAIRNEFNLYPEGGNLATTDNSLVINAPAGTVDEATLVVIESAATRPRPPKGFSLGTTVLTVDATSASGVKVTKLNEPVEMCLSLTNEEVAEQGPENVHKFRVGFYDDQASRWELFDSRVDLDNMQVCTYTDHWSLWAVLIEERGLAGWLIAVSGVGGVACASLLVLLAMRSRMGTRIGRAFRRNRLCASFLARTGPVMRRSWARVRTLFSRKRRGNDTGG